MKKRDEIDVRRYPFRGSCLFALCVWVSSAGRELQCQHRGHSFESLWSPQSPFFRRATSQLQLRWSHLHFIPLLTLPNVIVPNLRSGQLYFRFAWLGKPFLWKHCKYKLRASKWKLAQCVQALCYEPMVSRTFVANAPSLCSGHLSNIGRSVGKHGRRPEKLRKPFAFRLMQSSPASVRSTTLIFTCLLRSTTLHVLYCSSACSGLECS